MLVLLVLIACLLFINLQPKEEPAEPVAVTVAQTEEQTEPTQPPAPPEPIVATWYDLPDDYIIASPNYFVYDVTAAAYVTKSADPAATQVYPASITKLFTVHVALQYLDPDAVVTVGPEIKMIDPDSTVAQLEEGDVVTVRQLVQGMLLPSGNDAAYALAAAAGKVISPDKEITATQAVAVFVQEMNRQAKLLGMTGSHFCNPDGIHDDEHYLSMEDMVMLGKISLENPLVMECTQLQTKDAKLGDRDVTWSNTNALVRADKDYYCEYAIGLKTGRTNTAGNCLLSAFVVRDRILLIGVYGAPELHNRFEDTLYLLNTTLGLE